MKLFDLLHTLFTIGGTSLHFNGDGIRSAVTNPFDARNVEDFTFVFYYGDDCTDSSSGMQVIVALSNDFGVSWNVIRILGKEIKTDLKLFMYFQPCLSIILVHIGQVTQGSVSVAINKDFRTRNVMIGWFQFQHEDGTADSWTIDSVNITLSLNRGTSGGSGSGSGGSGTPAWIFGIIAGIVVAAIIFLIVGVVVLMKRRSKKEKYIFEYESRKPVVDNAFQNPLYSDEEFHTSTQEVSLKE